MQGAKERAGCKELSINNRQLRRMGNTPQGGAIAGNTADDVTMALRNKIDCKGRTNCISWRIRKNLKN
jgi:hypothetical protein